MKLECAEDWWSIASATARGRPCRAAPVGSRRGTCSTWHALAVSDGAAGASGRAVAQPVRFRISVSLSGYRPRRGMTNWSLPTRNGPTSQHHEARSCVTPVTCARGGGERSAQ